MMRSPPAGSADFARSAAYSLQKSWSVATAIALPFVAFAGIEAAIAETWPRG